MNSYLTIAAKVLREARQPLSAPDILKAAYRLQIVPPNLYGKTQYKTLHARLAEDILRHRSKSIFIRIGPGRFFLRSLLSDRSISPRYKREYIAPLRADQLQHFDVLCVEKTTLELAQKDHGTVFSFEHLQPFIAQYKTLSKVRRKGELFFIRIFVIVQAEDCFLLRRGWSSSGDCISDETSVGLLGYVKREDKTLFSQDPYGIREAASRTLSEQLHWPSDALGRMCTYNDRSIYFIVDIDNQEFGRSAAIVVTVKCLPEVKERDYQLNSDSFQWYPLTARINNEDQFERWSKYVLKSQLLTQAVTAREMFRPAWP